MAVVRYEPWNVVSQLQNEINRVFGNLNDTDSNSATSQWSPAVDVREYSDRIPTAVGRPGRGAQRRRDHTRQRDPDRGG